MQYAISLLLTLRFFHFEEDCRRICKSCLFLNLFLFSFSPRFSLDSFSISNRSQENSCKLQTSFNFFSPSPFESISILRLGLVFPCFCFSFDRVISSFILAKRASQPFLPFNLSRFYVRASFPPRSFLIAQVSLLRSKPRLSTFSSNLFSFSFFR